MTCIRQYLLLLKFFVPSTITAVQMFSEKVSFRLMTTEWVAPQHYDKGHSGRLFFVGEYHKSQILVLDEQKRTLLKVLYTFHQALSSQAHALLVEIVFFYAFSETC